MPDVAVIATGAATLHWVGRMGSDVLGFEEIDPAQVALVGGKGAHLAALSRIDGIPVPPGFCITTEAFERVAPDALTLPDDLAAQIARRLTDGVAYAVRSSATAEDLPNASFAGQHDTYLNVIGPAAVLEHVLRCWKSLFTGRAVAYRQRNRFDAAKVRMAVVVQQMVAAQAAGVLFTADPLSGNRKVAVVEAVFGLGEVLVSGKVNPASYRARDGALVSELPAQPVLTAAQALRLVELGRKIEAHFGSPQDIEWCLAGDGFHFVQSRPITTLFPIPAAGDGENRVYLSVGHQQMMTEAMKPLGLSFWRLTSAAPMVEAGGRLFVDVTRMLASPGRRAGLLELFGKTEPLVTDAVQTVLARGFVRTIPDEGPVAPPPGGAPSPLENDPTLVTELIARAQASIDTAKRDIQTRSGAELLDFIFSDLQELKRVLFDPKSSQAAMAGMQATWWLNARLQEWLGEKNAADVLTQSAPNNVTSQMGLALLDVADVVRAKPNGPEAREAVSAWLEKYGMRCVGEIDITRPRWAERPDLLMPMIESNVKNFEPGAGRRRFDEGLRNAAKKEHELLERLRALPDGERKAEETKRMIDRLRTFIGYREFPKFGMISRYFVYRQALLKEAERLVAAGVLGEKEDVYFLSLPELRDVVRTQQADSALIRQRKEAFRSYQALMPPRVLTSEGEGLSGSFRRGDVPQGALVGLGVSAGTVEGRARVVLDPGDAALEPGDILVTVSTDPSWTPAFVAIKGLVTEVGGLMTHGAVITREYGLPAVVGVERATSLIRDGRRIRVHGTEGYVELLS